MEAYLHDGLLGVVLVGQLLALLHGGQAQDAVHRVVVRRRARVAHASVHELLHGQHGQHHSHVLAAVPLHHHEVAVLDLVARTVREELRDALELHLLDMMRRAMHIMTCHIQSRIQTAEQRKGARTWKIRSGCTGGSGCELK
jgi:hypothetical protein